MGSYTVNQSYQDQNGNYKPGGKSIGVAVPVTFDASNPGRTTFSADGEGTNVMYLFNNNDGFWLFFEYSASDGTFMETGWAEPQTEATFTYAAVAGTYLMGQMARIEPGSNGNVGEWVLSSCASGSASCGFTGSVTTGGEGDFSYDQSFGSMTYNWDTTVTGTASYLVGTSPKGLSCIVMSATKEACIFDGDDSPSVVILQQ